MLPLVRHGGAARRSGLGGAARALPCVSNKCMAKWPERRGSVARRDVAMRPCLLQGWGEGGCAAAAAGVVTMRARRAACAWGEGRDREMRGARTPLATELYWAARSVRAGCHSSPAVTRAEEGALPRRRVVSCGVAVVAVCDVWARARARVLVWWEESASPSPADMCPSSSSRHHQNRSLLSFVPTAILCQTSE